MKLIVQATIILLVILVSCMSNRSMLQDKILVKWVEPVPGQENVYQGIKFLDNNVARSINMATLEYDSWKLQDSVLLISGKSVGNRLTIDFEDTLRIISFSDTSMVLAHNGFTMWNLTRVSD